MITGIYFMLSYQHGYHAGNFADVVKHLTLSRILNYLKRKDKPFFYFESHAGKGLYDLQDTQATMTGEYKQGIDLLWPVRNKLNPLFTDYLECIAHFNDQMTLRYYPGSPALAIQLLRNEDRGYFCELHPKEYHHLASLKHYNKKIHVTHTNGVTTLPSLLPPFEKRGLIFLDPSYEMKEDYKNIPKAMKDAYSRFSTGIYCLWYPLLNNRFSEQLLRHLQAIESSNNLRIEFNLSSNPPLGMSGCGLWIINPPFTLANEMKTILEQLKIHFNSGDSSYIIKDH